MSTGFVMGAPDGKISKERGVIEGVSVTTVGEAKGHGVNLDSEFVATVVEMGNEKRQGLKARYGHPNMSSTALGTFLGRFKNFRQDGDQARADLFLSNEAKDTPQGNLYDYVVGMAENEPDMFGTSIVFTPGREYKRDEKGEKVYHPGWSADEDETGAEHDARRDKWRETPGPLFIECAELHGCDAVDEPAANDGLFSKFSMETVAGQVTQFLDLHPQVWTAIETNPAIIEALGRYGDKMDGFVARYRDYRGTKIRGIDMSDTPDNSEQLEAGAEEVALEATEATEEEALEAATETTTEAAEVAEVEEVTEVDEPAAESSEPEEEPEALSREEFTRIADDFGAVIAVQTVKDGGNYQSALKASHDEQKAELETLRKLHATGAGTPAKVVAQDKAKEPLFKVGQKQA